MPELPPQLQAAALVLALWVTRELWVMYQGKGRKVDDVHDAEHKRITQELADIKGDVSSGIRGVREEFNAAIREVRKELFDHRQIVHDRLDRAQSALLEQQRLFLLEIDDRIHDTTKGKP